MMGKGDSNIEKLHGSIPSLFQVPSGITTKEALDTEKNKLRSEALRLSIEKERLEVYKEGLTHKIAVLMRDQNTLDRLASQLEAWEKNLDQRRKVVVAANAVLEGNESKVATENESKKLMAKL